MTERRSVARTNRALLAQQTLPLFLGALALIAIVFGVSIFRSGQNSAPGAVAAPRIELTSRPFPLTVGNNTFRVRLVGADGATVEAADVRVDAANTMPGTLPVSRPASATADGTHTAMLTLSMAGQWKVEIFAALPGGDIVSEHYDVFVYPVPPANTNPRTTYLSASELAALPHDPERELRIVIPQGTQAGIVGGHGEDVIGEEIRMNVSGRNVLVIRNDDIADHNVGPFFIRAGETLRQEFRRLAEFVGACSIRHGAEVTIIVEA